MCTIVQRYLCYPINVYYARCTSAGGTRACVFLVRFFGMVYIDNAIGLGFWTANKFEV